MSQSKVVLSPEQKFQQRVQVVRIAQSQGTQQAVLRSGTPERTVRRWVKNFKEKGLNGLKDLSRAPKRVANKKDVDGKLGQELVRLHISDPGLLRVQILAKLLAVDSPDVPSLSWLARATKRMGLCRMKRQKKSEHKMRYEMPTPGFLQIDTKTVEKDGEEGQKLAQFTAIDECTRVRYLSGKMFKSAECARQFLNEAVGFFASLGVLVVRAQTDNGTEFVEWTLFRTDTLIRGQLRNRRDVSWRI